jgi:murein DD-endopeptidase MepM/ murein hydrolase activator NlpD
MNSFKTFVSRAVQFFRNPARWKRISLPAAFRFKLKVIPETTAYRSRQFSAGDVALFLFLYGLLITLSTALVIYFTPITNVLGSPGMKLSAEQKAQFEKLDQKLLYLSTEIERLQENNSLLRKAITRDDSAALNAIIRSQSAKGIPRRWRVDGIGAAQTLLSNILEWFGDDHISFTSPVSGFISNRFRPADGHYGIDYALEPGSPVFAVANGYVIFADYTTDDGNCLILGHSDGYISVYKHCAQLIKRQRQKVVQGEPVALSGNSGRTTTGAHLHFELWRNGVILDPEKYLFTK